MNELNQRLNVIFQEVFGDDSLLVEPETTAADVPGWDSLTHVRLILAVERDFGIRFRGSEVDAMKSVGDLTSILQQHLDRK